MRAPARALPALALLPALAPRAAVAHERWVKHDAQPFDHHYFQSMTGEVLHLSLLAAAAVAVTIGLWYLGAVVLVQRLTPTSVEKNDPRTRRSVAGRLLAALVRFFLDGYVEGRGFARAELIAVFVFARLPALVFLLGAVQGWLVMPSFPVTGQPGLPAMIPANVILGIEVGLAIWVAWGGQRRALGAAFLIVFAYLCAGYGWAAVDALPVLASAFFYLFTTPGVALSPRQVAGIRLGLGVGFIFLGLVNKIYDAELFIGVGDNFPALLAGPRTVFPWLTRECWSLATALGEIVFGLLLFLGIFGRITSLVLALIFGNFILFFGCSEIVHLYPMAGFAVLFLYAAPGTALDGILFRTHVAAWRAMGYHTSFALYRASVFVVAAATAALLIMGPLYITIELVPRLFH
jgi:hypothetical protein